MLIMDSDTGKQAIASGGAPGYTPRTSLAEVTVRRVLAQRPRCLASWAHAEHTPHDTLATFF